MRQGVCAVLRVACHETERVCGYQGRMSMNSSRAKLNSYFVYHDRARSGLVGPHDMKRALDAVNFNIGEDNLEEM